jgi:lipopolysaccharide export system protein LptA
MRSVGSLARIGLALLLVGGLFAIPFAPDSNGQSQPKKPAPKSGRSAAEAPTVLSPLTSPSNPEGKSQPVTINADRMESLKKEGLIIFEGKVEARNNNNTQYADRMEVYLDDKGEKVLRTISTGNVKVIASDCRTGTARRAEYYDTEQKIILIGNARVWQDENVVQGERITMYLAEDRSVVESGRDGRVAVTFYTNQSDQGKSSRPTKKACQ